MHYRLCMGGCTSVTSDRYQLMVDSCCLCRLAEYAIIPHLNVMGAAAVVDYMYVEWHTWFGSVSPKQKEIASMAQAAMQAAGTQFPAYDSPA